MLYRYLQSGSQSAGHFYRRGEYLPIPGTPDQGHNDPNTMLQTISMTLSDIQVQLSSIQGQNMERDATLKQLQKTLTT